MTEIEATTRKWGNSLGITLPKDLVEEQNIQEDQKIIIDVKRVVDIKNLRGILQTKKSAQQLKDEMRTGWE